MNDGMVVCTRRLAGVTLATLLLASGPGCKQERPGAGSAPSGEAGGTARTLDREGAADLRLTPDGKHVTYLVDAQKPRLPGVPPQMLVGTLYAAEVEGGAPRKLGTGVTNVPGGSLFSPDGKQVLLLEGYNPAAQAGQLKVVDLASADAEPRTLGAHVTYMLVSPDSRSVAFVDGGVLKVGALPSGPFREVAGEVATAAFSADGTRLVFKRRLNAAASLAVVPADGSRPPQKLADQVGDYKLSPDGRHVAFTVRNPSTPDVYDLFLASIPTGKTARVAEGTTDFAFSPDGKHLARTEGARRGELGDLVVGPSDGGPAHKVGEKVADAPNASDMGALFAFAPDSSAVAFLEKYVAAAGAAGGAGTLVVAPLTGGEARRLGARVPNFQWSQDARHVAFVQRFLQPLYSVDLMLYRVGEEQARKLGQGVFGYTFAPGNTALLYRTTCVREGRACDLMKVDLAKPDAPARKLLTGVYSFKVSEDGQRLLTTSARLDAPTYDVGVQNLTTGEYRTLDHSAVLPAFFAARDGSRVVYLLHGRNRKGVHVATDVP